MSHKRLKKSVFNLVCVCGAPFTADHNQALYCSDECKAEAKRASYRKYGKANKKARSASGKARYEKNKEQVSARIKAYQQTEAGRAALCTAAANQRAKEPVKYHARTQVRLAVQKGTLVKSPCAFCDEVKVEAHHPDYEKPLDVIWLCPKCHKQLHREEISSCL